MKTLLCRDSSRLPQSKSQRVVAIGNFDGVHNGHKTLLCKLNSYTGEKVVVSFYPHPSVVLGQASSIPLLTTLRQKVSLLRDAGIDLLYQIKFSKKLAATSAQEFIDNVLIKTLKAGVIILGPDTAFGKNREGGSEFIQKYLSTKGIQSQVIQFHDIGGTRVSSRRIRVLLQDGKLTEANDLLGRKYRYEGIVERGDGRGRTLGFPTANVKLGRQVVPKVGVYATKVYIYNKSYNSVTNIGYRPTFKEASKVSIESHLIDGNIDLYDRRLELEFVARLRDEMKFTNAAELKLQIQKDIIDARALFK